MLETISDDFVEETFVLLSDLGYVPEDYFDEEEFWKAAAIALSKTQDFEDAKICVSVIKRCVQKMDMIERIFENKLDYWQYLVENVESDPAFATYKKDEDCYGHYFITNAIDNIDTIRTTWIGLEGTWYQFHRNGTAYENRVFTLKPYTSSRKKLRMSDSEGHDLCDIVLSDSLNIFLRNNETPFNFLLIDGERFVVVSKDYYESFEEGDTIDKDQILGEIVWDILDENSIGGVVKFILYEDLSEDQDINDVYILMMLTFCVALLLLYKQDRES